ncbi:hypothetical protein BO82DRAFT_381017 [Aspergillus uvarum CBS 121591]|uniref:Involucrin repeat protein n=1 Tax=Aspergillus uvarum CBS 121591 TaxID=1448315 RepID=A0A319D337_9EURO|nr:hypothetical protein BO82DRAFT_381017 [Aspergillus uvarum CBS 121591]PYH85483.1 hypothetical protein BO82DRAFT_381017 [Aspergillus uvarum CBS 121591]
MALDASQEPKTSESPSKKKKKNKKSKKVSLLNEDKTRLPEPVETSVEAEKELNDLPKPADTSQTVAENIDDPEEVPELKAESSGGQEDSGPLNKTEDFRSIIEATTSLEGVSSEQEPMSQISELQASALAQDVMDPEPTEGTLITEGGSTEAMVEVPREETTKEIHHGKSLSRKESARGKKKAKKATERDQEKSVKPVLAEDAASEKAAPEEPVLGENELDKSVSESALLQDTGNYAVPEGTTTLQEAIEPLPAHEDHGPEFSPLDRSHADELITRNDMYPSAEQVSFDEDQEVEDSQTPGSRSNEDLKALSELLPRTFLIRNEQMDNDMAEGSCNEQDTPVPSNRKLSKKERRRAKQKAEKEAAQTTRQVQHEKETSQAEISPVLPATSIVHDERVPINPSEGKPQETDPMFEQPAEDDNGWPLIDWGKAQIDTTERTPDSSPEARAIPFEPGIAEFDETAIPEGITRRSSLQGRYSRARGFSLSQRQDIQEGKFRLDTAPLAIDASTTEGKETRKGQLEDVGHEVEGGRAKESEAKSSKPSLVASIFPELERGFFRRPASIPDFGSAKDGAEEETIGKEAIRDSDKVLEAPIATEESSGSEDPTPKVKLDDYITTAEQQTGQLDETESPVIDVEVGPAYNVSVLSDGPHEASRSAKIQWEGTEEKGQNAATHTDTPIEHQIPLYAPSPLHERSSVLIRSSPSIDVEVGLPAPSQPESTCELRRSPSIHGRHGQSTTPRHRPWSLDEQSSASGRTPSPPGAGRGSVSPPRTPLHTIKEHELGDRSKRPTSPGRGTPHLEMEPEHVLSPTPQTPPPSRKFTDNALARQAWPTSKRGGDDDEVEEIQKRQPDSWRGLQSELASGRMMKTPEQEKPILRPTRSNRALRRTPRSMSGGGLRAVSQALEAEAEAEAGQPPSASSASASASASDLNIERIASSSSYDPVTDKGKRPLRNMTDVYEGWGETPSSPRSPSRPPSIRHRRSMQHLQELESRLDSLISENRLLVVAREAAEDKLRNASVARRKSDHALNRSDADLRDRSAEVEQLKSSVEWLQKEVSRMSGENEALVTTNSGLTATHASEIQAMQGAYDRKIEELRTANQQLATEMQTKIRQEIDGAVAQKDHELRRLREELETTRDRVKQLQQQIAENMRDEVLVFRDEDYFDAACQKLCGHVQQWVLRFSKHSDHRRCRKLSDLQDEKIADRFENAILDGSEVDLYLADRVRRRDVFMSVVMTMVWEYIFTRYLFGMDRDQRQKLKSLEKQLSEVGTRSSIHRWRATTLTLLARRPIFSKQRETDTEAVALEIFDTLSRLLPPPSNIEAQLLDSLRKVLRVAVHLSIEMRTQLAEYIMLPPLQPEYDTNGDLSRQVYFNASLMNERSGETTSNAELESQQAVVRIVLFPLVVKKGNDAGDGDDEVVVCPAQVLIARPNKDKRVSKMLSGDRMSIDATRSVHSAAPSSTMDLSHVI